MGPLFRLAQIVSGSANHHIMAVIHKIGDAVLQRQQPGASFHQGDAIHAEATLQRSHLEEFVQYHASIGIPLDIDDDAHTLAVALVVGVADAVQFLFVHQLGDVFYQLSLVDSIGNLCYHDLVVLLIRLDVSLCSHDDASATSLIGILYALQAHDVSARWEIRSLHPLHQFLAGQFRIVNVCHTGINHFVQIMGRDIRCHTNCNTCSTIDKQIGNLSGHYGRLNQRIIEIRGHIHSFLIQILHHGLAHQTQACLRVTHRSGSIAIHASEVSLPVHKCVPHVPILSHTHQCAINRAVAMRVILSEYLTHDTCTFLIRFVVSISQALHTI